MTFVIFKPVRRFIPILRNCYAFSCNLDNSLSYHCVSKERRNFKLSSNERFSTIKRNVSSSNLAKSSETNESNPKDEQKINMDDVEFQDILSGLAKDFDVGSDSEQVLEEIRESLDEPDSDQTSSKDQSSCVSQNSKEYNCRLKEKFKDFSDKDSVVIPSSEELQANKEDYVYHISHETNSDLYGTQMILKRGIRGVFDIEEIVDVLKKENLDDVAAISVPKELHYTDYLVIATAKSPRHSKAAVERIIKLYKLKKDAKDPFVVPEGEKGSDWNVIDMRNIVLHIFLEETRTLYDIESLWLFDSAFDRGGNLKDDPLYTAIEQQMAFFNSINETLPDNSKQNTI